MYIVLDGVRQPIQPKRQSPHIGLGPYLLEIRGTQGWGLIQAVTSLTEALETIAHMGINRPFRLYCGAAYGYYYLNP